jgi:hypothetical protein
MSHKTSIITAAIKGLNETVSEIRGQQAALRQHRRAINRALRPLQAAHKAGLLRYVPDLSISGKGSELWEHIAVISASSIELDSFKDKRLEKILARYVEDDFHAKTSDWAAALNRDFIFTKKVTPTFMLKVVIYAYVRSDSPTCKKVLKSTRTEVVERNEYEIVCS